jgi:hypothetical protein
VKFEGFIGGAYLLESVGVDAQRCVNLYPEVIESGKGKEAQVAYLKSTPGLEKILEVGLGPIRAVHTDSIGRIFVVSGNKLFLVTKRPDWTVTIRPVEYDSNTVDQSTGISTTDDEFTCASPHGFESGVPVRFSSSGTLPTTSPVIGPNTTYRVIVTSATKFKIAGTVAAVLSGSAYDVTATGSGTLTVTPMNSDPLVKIPYQRFVSGGSSPSTYLQTDHGIVDFTKVKFTTTGLYPGAFSADTFYYVRSVTDHQIQFYTSLQNANSFISVPKVLVDESIVWASVEIGSEGIDEGEIEGLSTSFGVVNAASMSALGDGSDSSVVFVDGVANYLFLDDPGLKKDFFGYLNAGSKAEATFFSATAFATMDLFTRINPSELDGKPMSIVTLTNTTNVAGKIGILIFQNVTTKALQVSVLRNSTDTGKDLTTAELVEFINTGKVTNRSDVELMNQLLGTSVVPYFGLEASGGGADSVFTAVGTSKQETLSVTPIGGFGYDSVDLATHIVWIDGYFIVNEGGTNKFYVSDLKGFNMDALSFTSAEGSPDIIIALISNHRDLWVFGERSIEVYTNTGNADFPFERIPGGFLEVGCAAGYSVAKIDGTIFWLGRSNEGQGQVFAAKGMTPQRVSTHAIEQAISSYANPSSATAYTYESKGHKFYVLNFDEATWVYDLTTGLWHERAYTSEGTLVRHRASTCAYSSKAGVHLVGDYQNNKLYVMRDGYYMDDEDAITRLRSTPHVSSGLDRLFCPKFQVDMEVGVGLDGGGQGSDPQVMLDWSDDGGNTWSSEIWAALGRVIGGIGEFKTRVIWRRLGSFRDRVFRLKVTDPVKVTLLSAEIDVEKGSS